MVDLAPLDDVLGLLVDLIADGLCIVSGRGDEEIQRLHTSIAGAFGHDIKELAVRLRVQFIKYHTVGIKSVLIADIGREHLVDTARWLINEPLLGIQYLDPFMELGIPTPGGKAKWRQSTVMSILQNEKYKGDALLQKKFTVDFLTKKQKVNEGEVPQYYVEGSHPAIISAMDFDMVQAEIARRQTLGRAYSGSSIFASKLICGDCGGFYGQKVWHSNDPYRRVIWRCNGKFNGEAKCETPTLDAEVIQQAFLKAFNQLMGSREKHLKACEAMREIVSDCTALDAEIDALNDEIQVVAELVNQCIKENASKEQSQEEYAKKYNRLVKRYEKATDRLKEVTAERESRMQRDRELRIFIGSIEKQPLVLEAWDEGLWLTLLETATVHKDNTITFLFKNQMAIEV